MGQFALWSELANMLRVMGCDVDEDGRFCVDGMIVSFMGAGEEFVIGDDAVFYTGGEPRSICNALAGTSYSHPVTVI